MLGMWMMSASLAGVWLWATGLLKEIKGYSMKWMVPVLLMTFILCKSTAAIAYLIIGIAILFLSKNFKNPLFLILLVAIPLFYLPTRATGVWTGENLVSFISENISEERAASLKFRMDNENILADKAFMSPLFGWATWGQARVYNDEGKDISVTDGLWIITYGNHGLVGLISLTLAILMPVFLLLRSYPASSWGSPEVAPAAVLSVLLALYMVDNLLNAMVNPIFIMVAGGVSGLPALSAVLKSYPTRQGEVLQPGFVYTPRFL
jgi:hypothetical protein